MALKLRPEWVALGVVGAFAVAMPVVLLLPGAVGKKPAPAPRPAPIGAGTMPVLARAYERPLFGTAEPAEAPSDAPQLVGIVGRLNVDAVALVKASDGATRTLRVGESVDGWSLASLAIDAAFFTRGGERVRVPLPIETGEAESAPGQ
ncbi:hypothetical protein P6144_09985 [Sphingomonas sp. HITSZ_GF]|uniref:hypothetical protein n=1 Tax=Sphingomonas sp. HITSZ_GF TaxID=3037247 RepID=UPI00240E22D8|nr:hypothetical protein [Sphingomonas sp. HITSZ_GF]MDG2533975.1 hypothetical protein [Sphingomonas sp. HITSZ_GF]